jgi:hypothetical protein
VSGVMARAFYLGGGLASTYWAMRPPPRGRAAPPADDSWHALLNRKRTLELLRTTRALQPYLPDQVALTLRHSLSQWGVGAELQLDTDGRLVRRGSRDSTANADGEGAPAAGTDEARRLAEQESAAERSIAGNL